jgi:hypothetical protein
MQINDKIAQEYAAIFNNDETNTGRVADLTATDVIAVLVIEFATNEECAELISER